MRNEKTTNQLTPEQSILKIVDELLEYLPSDLLSVHLNEMFTGYLDYISRNHMIPNDLSDRHLTVCELVNGFRKIEMIVSQQKVA